MINQKKMRTDNKPKQVSDTTGRPKPMVPKTALKKNGNKYKCGGRLKK